MMEPYPDQITHVISKRETIIEWIADGAVLGACFIVGLIGVIASNGITVLVSLTGLAGLAAWISANRPHMFLPRIPAAIIAALIAWAAITSLWTLDEVKAVTLCLRLAILFIAGFFMLHMTVGLSRKASERLEKTLLSGYGLGILALVIGYAYAEITGDSLWGSYYFDPLTTLNNGAVVIALLLWPVASIVWRQRHPALAFFLVSAVICGLLFLSSGASLLSIVAGLFTFIVVLAFGRPGGLAIATTTVGLLLLAPALVGTVLQLETIRTNVTKAPASVEHRLRMWDFVDTKISEKPFFGWGMDASRELPQDAFRLAQNMEIMPLHPHNAALQIRLELGWPGVIITAALILATFQAILNANLPKFQIAIRAAAASAYLSVGAVSYGVWQNWWIAVAWALAATVAIATTPKAP